MEGNEMGPRWKILIADDEFIIREGIRAAMPWDVLNIEVVAEAEDGEEALELALQHQVDIMLVDLNMPIMNGLTLMKHLRQQHPACRIVIITGHDEFAYAQEAIRLEVDDYILKPVNPEQLTTILERITKGLAQGVQEEKYLNVASRQIVKNLSILRERFCLEWMEGNLTDGEIEEQLEFLQLPKHVPNMVGVLRWFEKEKGKPFIPEKDRQLYLYAIENIAAEFLLPWKHVIFRDHFGLVIILVWAKVSEETLELLTQSILHYLKITTFKAFEAVDDGWNSISLAYNLARANVYKMTQLSPMVRRGRQYILDHYSNSELSLDELADTLQVSPVYLSRQFKEELGASFIYILTEIRIKKAIELLDQTEHTMNDIAELVGFDNQHYFSTSFKKTVGISPNQYRRGTT
jgi:two-component system response regulator YesN